VWGNTMTADAIPTRLAVLSKLQMRVLGEANAG
jgi:hypothetical protein